MVIEISQEETAQRHDDFIRIIRDSGSNISESVPLDVLSQVKLQNLAEKVCKIHHSYVVKKRTAGDIKDDRMVKLVVGSRDIYSELLNHFKVWKPHREDLIETLRRSTKVLERNSTVASSLRILTSAVDIFGNLTKNGGQPENSWAGFLVENVTAFGLATYLVETTYFAKLLNDIKKSIAKERESFKKITQWYEKTKELDKVIESFFPYDVDTDIAKMVNTLADKDDYEKIFMTIVASNWKRNAKLVEDEKFLKTVDRIATSEAAKLWYHKTILQDIPYLRSFFEASLRKEMQHILAAFQPEDREILFEACRSFSKKANMKIAIDVISIISGCGNILYGAQYDTSKSIEKFSKISEEEFHSLQRIVGLLKPSEAEVDPILQENASPDAKKCS